MFEDLDMKSELAMLQAFYSRDDIWDDSNVILPEPKMTQNKIIIKGLNERDRQDKIWGGPDHDDQHTPADWEHMIHNQVRHLSGFSAARQEERLIQALALCMAALESHYRKYPYDPK